MSPQIFKVPVPNGFPLPSNGRFSILVPHQKMMMIDIVGAETRLKSVIEELIKDESAANTVSEN